MSLIIIASIYQTVSKGSVHSSALSVPSQLVVPLPGMECPRRMSQKGQRAFPLALAAFICGPASFTGAPSGLIMSHRLSVRTSMPTYSLFPFYFDPRGPGAEAHSALSDTTFSAAVLSAVSVAFDSPSHSLSAPSEPTAASASQPTCAQSLFSECSAVSLPSCGIVGAALLAYPGTRASVLWSNYLIWGNYS